MITMTMTSLTKNIYQEKVFSEGTVMDLLLGHNVSGGSRLQTYIDNLAEEVKQVKFLSCLCFTPFLSLLKRTNF